MSLMNSYATLSPEISKGEGVYLYDTNENKYLDFTSGIGVNSLGYNYAPWVEAVSKQASSLQHCSNIFFNPTTKELAEKICELSGMSKLFLSNSGAEANEGAIKLARKYSYDKYGEGRNKVLTLVKSFHGRTMATLSATGQDKFHKYFFPFNEGFDYVEANNINDFKEKLTDDVCAIMMEAIQGEGGVNPLSQEFVSEVVSLCNSKDVLVIFDEVQCGIGRTGELFGFNNFKVSPDIVTLAKGFGAGLPIGGVLCNEKLENVFTPGDHGSTFGGNPVCCAGALVVLNTLCNNESFKAIKNRELIIRDIINSSNCSQIEEVRGMGLMIGIQTKIKASLIQAEAMKNGLLVLTAGEYVVRLLPPLVVSDDNIKEGMDILIKSINNLG
ncbi:MAG: aspartate aminotransferase family protein [Clostridium sp.]